MGTNYYANFETCPTCGKPKKEVHIGKSSCGWQFHFYGERPEIVSKKHWEEALKQPNVIIKNEYDEVVDHEEFWDMVYDKQNEENLNFYRVVLEVPDTKKEREYLEDTLYSHQDDGHEKHTWIDKEGYAFSEQEFS